MLHRGTLTIMHVIAVTVRGIGYAVVWPFRVIARGIALIVRAAVNGIAWAIRTIVHAIAQTVRAIVHSIAQIVRAIANGVVWIFRTIAHAIAQTVRAILHGIAATFKAIGNGLAWIVRAIGRAITNFFRATAHGIAAIVHWMLAPVRFVALRLRPLTVTLSVEEGAMRVVVFHGRQVVKWDHVTVESDESDESDESADAEEQTPAPVDSSGRLRRLLAELDARRGRLVTDLPMYAPLMRHFQLPKSGGRYLENMVVSEVLDTIPFDVDEVDITWRGQRNRTRQEVVAVAVPKEKIDGQVRLAGGAGLPPRAAYSKASALAFAAGYPNAIVINVQPSETAVILVRGGSPRILHRLEINPGAVGPQEQADATAVAVQQVVGYYQPFDPETDSTPLPLVIIGHVSADPPLAEILSQSLGRDVLPFAPAVDFPDDFPQSEYAVNLGLFLADQAKGKPRAEGPIRMAPAINLLPERHLAQGLPVMAFLSFAILVLLGTAVFPATSQIDAVAREAQRLSIEKDRVMTEENQQMVTLGRERKRQKLLLEDQRQALGMETRLAELKLEMDTLVDQLRAITEETLPFTVDLASVDPKPEGIALSGVADSYGDVFQYAENLRASPQFEDARVQQVTRAGPGDVSFTMLAFIPQPMEEEEEEKKP